jgi:glycosyltransferase involved in cell wall biosynthesis
VQVEVYHYITKKSRERKIEDYFTSEELAHINFHEFVFPVSAYFPGHYIYNSYRYSLAIYHPLNFQMPAIDFIYIQGFAGLKLLREKKAGKPMPPVGVNFHGLEMFQRVAGLRSKLEQYLYRTPVRFCLRQADIVFSLGGKLTDILKKQAGPSTQLWETPIGIEEKWLAQSPSSPKKPRKFIFTGRFERRKGIQELNKALAKIGKTQPFDFEFIGPIPEKHRLHAPNIHYHGAIYDEDEIIRIVSGGDVLVCPSYAEGMPTVILEAMARGLAVIATDVGAVQELVSAGTGWLIKPAKRIALEEALQEAITLPDEQLQQKKSAALALIKKKFTWNNVINTTLNRIRNR